MSGAGTRRRVCLVIGAGDGLGASIARAFAREGVGADMFFGKDRLGQVEEAVDFLRHAVIPLN
jgi:NAD(P)-dependent dehydrogenase (short-subunit alcohol dehydrogenase family)